MTYVRAAVVTALAFLTALAVAIADNAISAQEWVTIAIATVSAFGAYLGIGATTSVEPGFGKK